MCMYSVIMDSASNIPLGSWNGDVWSKFNEILAQIKALDIKLGQKDCEDPNKAIWMREMERRVLSLEIENRLNANRNSKS